MFTGLYINYRVIQFKTTGIACDLKPMVAITGLSLYSLFLILFLNYFVRSYLLKPKSKSNTFLSINNNICMPSMSGKYNEKYDNNNNLQSLERKVQ